jgi:hypothetical protein
VATADTARLIASLELQDKNFTRGLDKATRGIDRVDKKLGAFSGAINRNLGRALDAGISRGVRALTNGITGGLESLATLEDATTSGDAAISQMGKTGKVSAGQVATWANDIERDIGAAFDDKDILAATTTLVRFGKTTPENIRPAMEVMTDLATKTGDVEGASSLLAKALADPTKAAGKLSRYGIILTDTQQDQIKAFVKAGKVGKAQALILDSVAKSTDGAAEASQGKYRRALSTLTDVSEDAKRALAEGFLPVIERVADKLQTALADKGTMTAIRNFGSSLASGFDKAIDILEGVDWNAVGAGLKSAADWAGKIGSAFMGLPAEAKGIIIGLAGLTKLTGGAPIKIAVDFAKDALGGVFGHFFDRGSSAANPLWVTSKGLPTGTGDGGPGGTGIKDLVKFGIVAAVPIAVSTAGALITREIGNGISSWVANGNKNLETILNNGFAGFSTAMNPIGSFIADIGTNIDNLGKIPGELGRIADFISGNNKPVPGKGQLPGAPGGGRSAVEEAIRRTGTGSETAASIMAAKDAVVDKGDGAIAATDASKRAVASAVAAGAITGAGATRTAGGQVRGQVAASGAAIVGAVRASRDIVNVNVQNNISGFTVTSTQTTVSRTSQSSSKTNDERHYG